MHGMLIALMVTWACVGASQVVVVKSFPPPPYSESRVLSDRTRAHVFQYLEPPMLTPEQRNYAVLGLALITVAQSLARGNDYERAFDNEGLAVWLAEFAPEAARKLFLKQVYGELEAESPITRLLDELCYPGSPFGTVGRKCNELVHKVVQSNPKYQRNAAVLLNAGKFGALYDEHRAAMDAAVRENRVQEYLENNKYELEPFIVQMTTMINLP